MIVIGLLLFIAMSVDQSSLVELKFILWWSKIEVAHSHSKITDRIKVICSCFFTHWQAGISPPSLPSEKIVVVTALKIF